MVNKGTRVFIVRIQFYFFIGIDYCDFYGEHMSDISGFHKGFGERHDNYF